MEVLPSLAGVRQRSCFRCPSASCRADVPTDVSWASSPGETSGESHLEQPLSPCSGAEVGLPTVPGTRKGETQTSCTSTEIPSQPYGPLIIPNKHYRRAIQYNGQEPHGAQ